MTVDSNWAGGLRARPVVKSIVVLAAKPRNHELIARDCPDPDKAFTPLENKSYSVLDWEQTYFLPRIQFIYYSEN
jgi:hypothetical protein